MLLVEPEHWIFAVKNRTYAIREVGGLEIMEKFSKIITVCAICNRIIGCGDRDYDRCEDCEYRDPLRCGAEEKKGGLTIVYIPACDSCKGEPPDELGS